MYAEEVDRDLITAVIEALGAMQEPSGKWPTTHPIIRPGRVPWYIASSELALSLTWLYFQPALPDQAQFLLLRTLEKHFRNWILPTFRRAGEFHGWYDDSGAGHERVVGWVTAIVCHFLANYNAVLNDHINRRVIESLGLQSVAKRYLIDETLRNRKKKWKVKENAPADDRSSQAWPDLPPAGWRSVKVGEEELSTDILSEWADPETAGGHSRRLARWVIKPILDSPQNRPVDYAAGILLGPPGTRKTTLVDVLSKMLEWPYVPVPASTIFEKGFDPMEARASEVFRRLNFLTQCVIFFDEFDEFFLSRPDPAKSATLADAQFSSHDRTVAAFTTSAMLPRLQDLHDEKRSLIFFATNYFDKIDEAVVRAGRFDFQVQVNHPEVGCFARLCSRIFLPATEENA